MTMISKKVFTSSNNRLLLLPAFMRAFLIMCSLDGEVSYDIKKNTRKRVFSACGGIRSIIFLSAAVRSLAHSAFLYHRKFGKNSYDIKRAMFPF